MRDNGAICEQPSPFIVCFFSRYLWLCFRSDSSNQTALYAVSLNRLSTFPPKGNITGNQPLIQGDCHNWQIANKLP